MSSGVGRRELILVRARRLFAERGVTATTVRDIAEAVGMLSGSLYHHYPSKDAIVDAVLVDYLDHLVAGHVTLAEREPEPLVRVVDLVRFTFDIGREMPEATAIFQRDGAMLAEQEHFAYVSEAATQIREIWIAALEAGKAAGVVRPNVDADLTHRVIRDAVCSAANWFVPHPGYPTSRFLKDCSAVFLTGYQVA